jgi:hypothetical protein
MREFDPTRIEMINRLQPGGFRYTNSSFLAERVEAVPDLSDLAGLAGRGWWDADSAMGGFVRGHDGGRPAVETRLRIVHDDEALFAAFHLAEPRMDKANAIVTIPGVRQVDPVDPVTGEVPMMYVIEKDDHVQLLLDFTHGHGKFVRFLVNLAGVGYAEQTEVQNSSEAVYPGRQRGGGGMWNKPYRHAVAAGKDHWCAAFRIPWSSIALAPGDAKVMGVQATRCRTVGQMEKHRLCFSPFDVTSAMEFADLYLGSQPLALEELDFGLPVFADNSFTFKVSNPGDAKLALVCRARVTVDRDGHEMSDEHASVEIAPGKSRQVKMHYSLDWREDRRQTLELTMSAPGGEVLLAGRYYFSHTQDITAEEPHEFVEPAPNPDPADEDFVAAKRRYLLSRIPYFRRATTQDGAPSDFTLRSARGKWEFNLMQPGVMGEIAAMIESVFDDPTDRLAASSLLAHQKAFSMHMNPHISLHELVTPLSALRLNAGHCYSRALVWMGIARRLAAHDGPGEYGQRVHCVLVLHHVMGCIDVGDDERWMFDPTVGSFFYAWDNKRFATAAEMEADPSIPARMMRTRPTNFNNIRYHRLIPAGQVVFPQGAVAD